MNSVEYKDKLWKYWHGKLDDRQRELLWAEIHRESMMREKRAHFVTKIIVMTIVLTLITYLLIW